MILIELMGGLGNQMFQYAFGRRLSIDLQCELYINSNSLNNFDTIRTLELDYFNTHFKIANHKINKIFINNKFDLFNRLILSVSSLGKYKKIKEDNFKDYKKMPIRNNTYYKGYFQHEEYFNSIKEILVHDFALAKPLDRINQNLVNQFKKEDSVFVHIRRGDFLTSNGYHKVYDKIYYEQAINQIMKEKDISLQFYFFSDDINWVQQNFIAENYHYITHNIADESYKDLVLMSNCKYAIFGNSTFAWWANWLRENKKDES
ncbi:MAG: alpha-1,2-fucosyltransferase [Chitinophagales bacterium]|nr:alpha-1,2-fucosyltransferase [Chitinophagales bacterium]